MILTRLPVEDLAGLRLKLRGRGGFNQAFHPPFVLTKLITQAPLEQERRSGRIHAPYLLLLGALLLQQGLLLVVPWLLR